MSEEQLKNQPQEYLVTDLSDPAEAAIKGMPKSTVADVLRVMEHERLPTRNWTNGEELRILRKEVALLAVAYVGLQNKESGAAIQQDFYQAYVKQNDELRQFRGFLAEHFAAQLDEGVELNLPLLQVAKKLLLEYKKKV